MAKGDPSIEFRHLRSFLAVAAQGSFRQAGIAIGVRESAISRRIHDLEDQLDASLLQRHNGGVHIDFIERETAQHAEAIRRLALDVAFVAGI